MEGENGAVDDDMNSTRSLFSHNRTLQNNESDMDSTQGARENFLRLVNEDVEVDEEGNLTIRNREESRVEEGAVEFTEYPSVREESHGGVAVTYPRTSERTGRSTLVSSMRDSCRIDSYSDDEDVGPRSEDRRNNLEKISEKSTRRKKRPLLSKDESEKEMGTFRAVKEDLVSYSRIRQDWKRKYGEGSREVAVDFLQFIIYSCGSTFKLGVDILEQKPATDIIDLMAEKPDGEELYPLARTGKPWKHFLERFRNFIGKWALEFFSLLVPDDGIGEKIFYLLLPMSSSKYRAFRHTATVAALKLGQALISNIESTSNKIKGIQKLLAKAQENHDSFVDRIESMERTVKDLRNNLEAARNLFSKVAETVLGDRYRDICPEIRRDCLVEIKCWMQESLTCVDSRNLQYIAMMLRDDVAEVREKSLKALWELYENCALKPVLTKFTLDYRSRILAMVVDDDFDVGIAAINVITSMYRMFKELFSRKELDLIYSLLYAGHRPLAVAAGNFFTISGHEVFKQGLQDSSCDISNETSQLLSIVRFFSQSDAPQHGTHLVDALRSVEPVLSNWKAMVELLTDRPVLSLTHEEELALIRLMRSAAEVFTSGLSPIGRTPSVTILLPSEAHRLSKDSAQLTKTLLPALPLLLRKFLVDANKTVPLLEIPLYFRLKEIRQNRNEESVKQLLEAVLAIIERGSGADVLEVAGKCLAFFDSEEALSFTELCVHEAVERVWHELRSCYTLYSKSQAGVDVGEEDVLDNLVVVLKKVSSLSRHFSFEAFNPWDTMKKMIAKILAQQWEWSDEIIQRSLVVGYHSMAWKLRSLQIAAKDAQFTAEDIRTRAVDLRKDLKQLAGVCCKFLLSGSGTLECKDVGVRVLCDVLQNFCPLATGVVGIDEVILEIEESLVKVLVRFIEENIFDCGGNVTKGKDVMENRAGMMNLLSLFCKLLTIKAIKLTKAADVFKYYAKVHPELAEILKTTLSDLKQQSPTDFADVLLDALTSCHREHPQELEELAKKFVMFFGPESSKNSEAITIVHRGGISYAFGSNNEDVEVLPNLTFFGSLSLFSPKLSVQDKTTILSYLTRECPMDAMKLEEEENETWQPVIHYRDSLAAGEDSQNPSVRRVLFGRRRRPAPQSSKRSRVTNTRSSGNDSTL